MSRPPAIDLPSADLIDRIRQHSRQASTPQLRTVAPELRIENVAAEVADVYIYDSIGFDGMSGIDAQQFAQEFRAIEASSITVHINSPGGDVFDAIAIYNAIRSSPSDVTVRVEGIAASAASFIAMAGDDVLMAPHAVMMIHDAWGLVVGPAADMRAEADVLDSISNTIASIYAEHASGPRGGSKGTTAQWRQKMLDETWFTDEQAVSAGLADGIDRAAPAAKNTFDLSHFRHAPAELLTATAEADQPLTERDAEQALRDAGYSRREAKAIVAEGYGALTLRDAEDVPSPEATISLARARLRMRELTLSA